MLYDDCNEFLERINNIQGTLDDLFFKVTDNPQLIKINDLHNFITKVSSSAKEIEETIQKV